MTTTAISRVENCKLGRNPFFIFPAGDGIAENLAVVFHRQSLASPNGTLLQSGLSRLSKPKKKVSYIEYNFVTVHKSKT